jgi:hypothetical protein
MKAIFTFTPKKSLSIYEVTDDLFLQDDVRTYLRGMVGKELTVEFKETAKLSEKVLLYAYYHRVVLKVAIDCFENDGWTSMDKVKADYILKAQCGKEIMYNEKTNQEQVYLFEKSAASKKDLYDFICRCITFLEVERGYTVPDSDSYLFKKSTGLDGFKKV